MHPGGGSAYKPEWTLPEPVTNLCRFAVWLSGIACVAILLYLGWGLLGGVYGNPNFHHLAHSERARHFENITSCSNALNISSLVFVISLLMLTYQDMAIGYILLLIATVLYFGFPYLTSEIMGFQNMTASDASTQAIAGVVGVARTYFAPGVIWTVVDLIRRVMSALENAAIQRANLRYGSNVEKQTKKEQRNVFLGRCWELAYCRDNVRVKCPIYLKRLGPCWWYKRGCMCDDKIVLNAVIDSDWKQKTANAVGGVGTKGVNLDAAGLGSSAIPQPILSQARKIERCRN